MADLIVVLASGGGSVGKLEAWKLTPLKPTVGEASTTSHAVDPKLVPAAVA